MLIDLIVEIIPLIIGSLTVKTDQFIRFILNTDIKNAAGCICQTCNAFQPAYNIITVKHSFAFKFVPALSHVTVGFAIIICALVASLLGAAFFPVKDNPEQQKEGA